MSHSPSNAGADDDLWIQEFLMPYALLGWEEWSKTDEALRNPWRNCLEGNVVANHHEVRQVVSDPSSWRNDSRFPLIPMPKTQDRIERAFFLPILEPVEGSSPQHSFDLFTIVKNKNCLAFRWELGHNGQSTHGYSHMQMSRRLAKRELSLSSLPGWIPDDYPAVPVRASNSFGLFLCMVTALHGLEGGILRLLNDVMRSQPGVRFAYMESIRQHFNP